MSNIVESKSEIQIDIPLTEDAKLKCANEMLDARSAIRGALSDIKDYEAEKKEEVKKYNQVISNAESRAGDRQLSKDATLALTTEIVDAFNSISKIEDDLKSYLTEKKAEIAKCEAIVNISLSKINRGRDFKWLQVKVLKDFDKKIKTFVDTKTGEVVKTLPMTDDDLQMPLAE
jgi:hypothetical protein